MKEVLKKAKQPLILLALLIIILALTGYNPPAGRLNWFLEVIPGIVAVLVLIVSYTRFPFPNFIYYLVFAQMMILNYGGYYTYALAPLGNWMKVTFHLTRNHYDRIGHFALGFVPAFVVREIMIRKVNIKRGAWLFFIVVSIMLAIGAFWELTEWWTTLVVAPGIGQAYLGTQGDVWDAQWDMLWVLIGGVIAMTFFQKFHDRAMKSFSKK